MNKTRLIQIGLSLVAAGCLCFPGAVTSAEPDDSNKQVRRLQHPTRPLPYDEEEVVIERSDVGLKLSGTLTLPRAGQPFPAVLLVQGGSAFDRDETLFGHKPFLVLADHLTRKGFAVLRLDDRGIGKSEGNKMTSSLSDLSGDVLAGVRYLRQRTDIDSARIGLAGHSLGGVLAPMAAAESEQIAFIVLMGSTGMPVMRTFGLSMARIDIGTLQVNQRLADLAIKTLTTTSKAKDAGKAIRTEWDTFVASLPEDQKTLATQFVEAMDQQLQAFLRFPLLFETLSYDPRLALMKVRCPVLVLCGDQDPTAVNLPAIADALEAGGNRSYQISKIPWVNHLLQPNPRDDLGQSAAAFRACEVTVDPAVLAIITDWLDDHTKGE